MKKSLSIIGLAVVVALIVTGYFLFFAPSTQIPRGGICETSADCGALNCKGVGPWYCDRDGYPYCGTDKVCTCAFACL